MDLLNKIFGEETEKQKKEREENAKIIENQNNIINNMKCFVCGDANFNKGYISTSGAYGGSISKIATYHNDYNNEYEDKVLVCNNCGYVIVFADFKTKKIMQL